MAPTKDDIVDYAMPLMNIERLARQAHDMCLEKNYDAAIELALKLRVEARILEASLAIMQSKANQRQGR